jgi:hypothetical protein
LLCSLIGRASLVKECTLGVVYVSKSQPCLSRATGSCSAESSVMDDGNSNGSKVVYITVRTSSSPLAMKSASCSAKPSATEDGNLNSSKVVGIIFRAYSSPSSSFFPRQFMCLIYCVKEAYDTTHFAGVCRLWKQLVILNRKYQR